MEHLKHKHFVTAVIINKNFEVLAVSRKTDHSDFGMPGGKVEEGETPIDACIREVLEETGLNVVYQTLVFAMHRHGGMGWTYLMRVVGTEEIHTNEPHIVKWTNYQTLIDGKFGKWNSLVLESLTDMGIYVQ